MKKNKLFTISILIVLIATLMPGNGKVAGNYLDKVVHFILFFFLSVNTCIKFMEHKKLIQILFYVVLLGFATEVAQNYIPGREMDIFDAIADTLGVMAGYMVYDKYRIGIDRMLLRRRTN